MVDFTTHRRRSGLGWAVGVLCIGFILAYVLFRPVPTSAPQTDPTTGTAPEATAPAAATD